MFPWQALRGVQYLSLAGQDLLLLLVPGRLQVAQFAGTSRARRSTVICCAAQLESIGGCGGMFTRGKFWHAPSSLGPPGMFSGKRTLVSMMAAPVASNPRRLNGALNLRDLSVMMPQDKSGRIGQESRNLLSYDSRRRMPASAALWICLSAGPQSSRCEDRSDGATNAAVTLKGAAKNPSTNRSTILRCSDD